MKEYNVVTHCIRCEKTIPIEYSKENVLGDDLAFDDPEGRSNPEGAVCFHATGNFGSSLFDPLDWQKMYLYLCDTCLGQLDAQHITLFKVSKGKDRYKVITPSWDNYGEEE